MQLPWCTTVDGAGYNDGAIKRFAIISKLSAMYATYRFKQKV